jgi:hypothetical protein
MLLLSLCLLDGDLGIGVLALKSVGKHNICIPAGHTGGGGWSLGGTCCAFESRSAFFSSTDAVSMSTESQQKDIEKRDCMEQVSTDGRLACPASYTFPRWNVP